LLIVMATTWFGWDIGGAHLKVAQLSPAGIIEEVWQVASPVWQGLDCLRDAITQIPLTDRGDAVMHAITMTGELCDLFADRASGVTEILTVVAERLPPALQIVVAGRVGWLRPAAAAGCPHAIASANWMASAALVAREIPDAVLLDIGSTTTDMIPVVAGEIAAVGDDDLSRLANDELVYSGVVRTPLMALCARLPYDGHWVNTCAENFSTTADVYRLTGDLPAGADLHPAADGRGKDDTASAARLLRMIGTDFDGEMAAAIRLANYIAQRHLGQLNDSLARILSRLATRGPIIVGAGVGRFLARRLARFSGLEYRDFENLVAATEKVSAEQICTCAPAIAVAALARDAPL
jgi:probable H4MPT-linked C1 transfer pathway protein